MRAQDEILRKIEEVKGSDFLQIKTGDLVNYLDYEHAKSYLKPEVMANEWASNINEKESILKEMLDYMPFAWEKANECRGISASRSMQHYSIWVWMLGEEELFANLENYEYYGKDNLVKICNYYGWDSTQWDDNIRVNNG